MRRGQKEVISLLGLREYGHLICPGGAVAAAADANDDVDVVCRAWSRGERGAAYQLEEFLTLGG